MLKSCTLLCFIFKVLLYSRFAQGEETEEEIRQKVLKDYNPALPPSLYALNPDIMFVNLLPLRISGLDEKRGEFSIEGRLMIAWFDARFTWESNKTKQFSVKHDSIWMPSLYVYNGVEPEIMTYDPLPVVEKCAAYWEPLYNIKASCNFNLRYYPFDKQQCDVILASRNVEGDFLSSKIRSRKFIMAATPSRVVIENPQWKHSGPKILRKKMKTDSDYLRGVSIYRFFVQRTMPLIPLGILTPCLCCTLLLLTTFWMEAGSTLRTGICVTSMLVSSSSLFTLGKILPASGSSTPIMVEYVSITLILSAISSIQATVSSIFKRCEKLPPVSYATIVSRIPRVCLVLMGIAPEEVLIKELDQKFLFSELDDVEHRNSTEIEENISNNKNSSQQSLHSLWLKYITLFDRITFYVLGLIILLFVVSVIITE